ncbi:MAG: 1-deoxy-D-xylulose-5-phosphate reductoisomerase [Planctomycetota bacterium]
MTTRTTTRLAILGCTGSIGTQTLDVVRNLNTLRPGSVEVVGLATGSRETEMLAQARAHGVSLTAVAVEGDDAVSSGTTVLRSTDAAERLVRRLVDEDGVDLFVGAIVGIAGLPATLAAVEAGVDVALANKETLVAAGELVTAACARTGARLLPIDSEHSALWQALQGLPPEDGVDEPRPGPPLRSPPSRVARLILTASGGPFRALDAAALARVTPGQALDHPTWSMGAKVTLDCASLMNKGLELMEACWLFGVPEDRVDILVHPGSTVHSLVEFDDRSVMAQLGPTDMRLPIQYAITWPDRPPLDVPPLDLAALGELRFERHDQERFPAPGLCRRAMRMGGGAGAVLNAANEVAVARFLADDNTSGSVLAFTRIPEIVGEMLEAEPATPIGSLGAVLDLDRRVRERTRRLLPG